MIGYRIFQSSAKPSVEDVDEIPNPWISTKNGLDSGSDPPSGGRPCAPVM